MTQFAFWKSNSNYNVQAELRVESLAIVQLKDGKCLNDVTSVGIVRRQIPETSKKQMIQHNVSDWLKKEREWKFWCVSWVWVP